jgi:hypothetical protein
VQEAATALREKFARELDDLETDSVNVKQERQEYS